VLNSNDTSVHLTLSWLVVHLLWHVRYNREIYWIPVAKPEGKRQPGRPMRRWKDNILTKMDLREIRRRGRGMDSSNPGQGQVSGSCEHGNEPSGLITCRVFSDNGEPYKGCAAGLRVFSGSLSFHRDHISERPWYRWAALREAPWRIAEPVVTVRQHIQISFNQAFQTVLLFLSKQTFTLSELLYIFTPAISQAFGNNWGSKRTLGQTEV